MRAWKSQTWHVWREATEYKYQNRIRVKQIWPIQRSQTHKPDHSNTAAAYKCRRHSACKQRQCQPRTAVQMVTNTVPETPRLSVYKAGDVKLVIARDTMPCMRTVIWSAAPEPPKSTQNTGWATQWMWHKHSQAFTIICGWPLLTQLLKSYYRTYIRVNANMTQ